MNSYTQFLKYAGIITILSIFWLGFFAIILPAGGQARQIGPTVGFEAPAFSLETLDGKTVTFPGPDRKPAIINLWATWCPPCKVEMPTLEKVYLDYKDKGLVVYGVNMASVDNPLDAANFVYENRLTFPIPLDRDGSVAKAFAMRSLPTTFFIDRDGVIRAVMIGGPFTEAFLRAQVEDLLVEER